MNRSFSLILFLPIVLLILMASSCKEKDPPKTVPNCVDYGTCETVMAAKQFFAFNLGSWWVYEEQTTHERDSLYVVESNNTSTADFDTRIFSTRENMYYHYFPLIVEGSFCQPQDQIHPDEKCIFIKKSKGNFGNFIGEDNCFFIQYWKGVSGPTFNQTYIDERLYVNDVLEGYSISGFDFQRTVIMYQEHDYLENDQTTYHYYSRNIGLVRKQLNYQIWNLVAYHIEP